MTDSKSFEENLKNIRKFIYLAFIEKSHAPIIEEMIEKFPITKLEAIEIFTTLNERHLIVLQPFTNRILMAHPFSNIPTCWMVKSGKKRYYANCAWDAVALHFTLHKKIEIDSFCAFCAKKINIQLKNSNFSHENPESTLIAISKPASLWWDNVIDTCANPMNFFCSADHLSLWHKYANKKNCFTK
jgi:hypothetical protein